MKRWFQPRWWWLALLLILLPIGAAVYVRYSTVNVLHAALDELSAVNISERWSHPQMLKIRERGVKSVPALRRVLREKNHPTTRFLLWVKTKWPVATKYYSGFPDMNKLTERRWAACQVIQTLGPGAKSAAPDIIEILKSNDVRDLGASTMALSAIGIDADICDRLGALLERGAFPDHSRLGVVSMLGRVKPPSERTVRVLVASLTDPYVYVPSRAAEALGQLGVRQPEVLTALKQVQSSSANKSDVIAASRALWELERDSDVLAPMFRVLEDQIGQPIQKVPGGGNGGQAVTDADQLFMGAAEVFPRMDLNQPDKSRALDLLEAWAEKSERIFIRMLLLPAMMDLGWPGEKCVEICKTGLDQREVYYRLQAARLLAMVSNKHPVNKLSLDLLMRDPFVGVRVYAAKIQWTQTRQPDAVVSILLESLDRSKHQSYYYLEIQKVALTVLGDMGPAAREAVGPLERLTPDPNPDVAKLANEALTKIRTKEP